VQGRCHSGSPMAGEGCDAVGLRRAYGSGL
jgi:hypothetical protein